MDELWVGMDGREASLRERLAFGTEHRFWCRPASWLRCAMVVSRALVPGEGSCFSSDGAVAMVKLARDPA